MSAVRDANAADLDAVAEMAGVSTDFAVLLRRPGVLFLIAEWGGSLTGFLIARPVPNLTIVDSGSTAMIENFSVETPAVWPSVGQSLLRQARARLRERGIRRIVVTSGDAEKNALLEAEKLSLVSEWWVAEI